MAKKVNVANDIVFRLFLSVLRSVYRCVCVCVCLLVSVINIDGEGEKSTSSSLSLSLFYSQSLDPSMRFEDKKPDGCFLVGNVDSDREREEPCMDRMDRSAGSEDPPRETLLLLFPPFHLDRKKKPKTGNQSRQLGRKPNGEKTRED